MSSPRSVKLTIKLATSTGSHQAQPPQTDFVIDIEASATVEELKEQVACQVSIPKEHIRLVSAGRVWKDEATVDSYGPTDGTTVHCLNNPPRSAPTPSEQTLSPVNPLQQMMGMPSLTPASSSDPVEQMMAQTQQMLTRNPEMMQQIMSSPMVQQMMSDPEAMRGMMRMHPRLNQLMEQRPEIARMLEDPEILQQSMQMVANPSLMREMTRNADRAIGQLNAMPGGHNALVRAHEEYADPIFNALGGGSDQSSGDVATYTQSTEGTPNSEALPNPWGPPAPTPATQPQTPVLPGVPTTNRAGGTPMVNPFAAAFQGFTPPPVVGAQPNAAPAANPMMAMVQQALSNPAQMAQMMELSRNLGGGFGMPAAPNAGTAGATPATPVPQLPYTPPTDFNPMMSMMQQMFNPAQTTPPAQPQATPAVAPTTTGTGVPDGLPTTTPPPTLPTTLPAAAPVPPAPGFPNPAVAAMVQQMMANPAQMAQMQQFVRQLRFGQAAGATPATPVQDPFSAMMRMMNNNAMTQQSPATTGNDAPAAVDTNTLHRAQFATQLAQLASMGFSDEAQCLRALVQHNGRIDAAIDALLSGA